MRGRPPKVSPEFKDDTVKIVIESPGQPPKQPVEIQINEGASAIGPTAIAPNTRTTSALSTTDLARLRELERDLPSEDETRVSGRGGSLVRPRLPQVDGAADQRRSVTRPD
jgi:hypothetical protein